ncbi:hypothetical protein AOLI_G00289620 [Acnodon oligacanthus]
MFRWTGGEGGKAAPAIAAVGQTRRAAEADFSRKLPPLVSLSQKIDSEPAGFCFVQPLYTKKPSSFLWAWLCFVGVFCFTGGE